MSVIEQCQKAFEFLPVKLLTDTKVAKISSEIYGIRKPYLSSVFWPRESADEQHPAGT